MLFASSKQLNMAEFKLLLVLIIFNFVLPAVSSCSSQPSEPKSGQKILIVTGYGPDETRQESTLIDVKNQNFNCDLPNFPIEVAYGVGGILSGEIPMVCGGIGRYRVSAACYKLVPDQWIEAGELATGRISMGTGNLVIDGRLLLSGGDDDRDWVTTTQLIDANAVTEARQDLPVKISTHCNVMLNSTHYMVIGGQNTNHSYRAETFIFDLVRGEWFDGPSMNVKRGFHGCARMVLGEKSIVWVTGGSDGEDHLLQSMEYLDLENWDQGWKLGANLPYGISMHSMVPSMDMKSIYITGGEGNVLGEIHELQCQGSSPDSCMFKPLNGPFDGIKVKRYAHVALPISDSLADKLCSE